MARGHLLSKRLAAPLAIAGSALLLSLSIAANAQYADGGGSLRVLLTGGPMETKGHPFFTATGPNGRACITCHQPADAMSLSAARAQERWEATGGKDPLFAAYDGSNCPNLPQADRGSHSLLLEHGLFRIQRPWPPRDLAGRLVTPDFDLEVVRDSTGCESGTYGPVKGNVSVYRRPRPVANLKYLLAIGFAGFLLSSFGPLENLVPFLDELAPR